MTTSNHDLVEWVGDAFFCDACEKPFRTSMCNISKGFERTIFGSDVIPEVEIIGSIPIGQYCSDRCRTKMRQVLLTNETVRATYPCIGPVEACSRCAAPVDMTKFHLTYVETDTELESDRMCATITDVVVLAVLCKTCAPPSQRLVADTDQPNSEQHLPAKKKPLNQRSKEATPRSSSLKTRGSLIDEKLTVNMAKFRGRVRIL